MSFFKVLNFLNLKFESAETESSYSVFQAFLQKKLLFFMRNILLTILLAVLIISISEGHSLCEIAIKGALPGCILIVVLLEKRFPRLRNIFFVIVCWVIGYFIPSQILDLYEKENRVAFFFVGYSMGIIEIIITFSIKNIYYRVALQTVLMVGKFFSFWDYLIDERTINISLWTVSLISIAFFLYHNVLDRDNFKINFDLSQKLQKFQTFLADDFPVSVIMITSDLSSLIYSNHCFRETFGDLYKIPSPVGFVRELFRKLRIEPDQDQKTSLFRYIQNLEASDENIKDIINLYATYENQEQRESHYEIKLRRIFWESRPAYTVILNDVSDKQLVLALKTADEEKERVIATISHELKTPINGIFGLLEMISNQPQTEFSQTYLDQCKSCSKLLLYFVDSILDLNQLRRGQLQLEKSSFRLDELFRELKSLYSFTAEHKGINLIIEKDYQVPDMIYTDRLRLAELLMLLLGNAIKFTSRGFVKLTVSCEKIVDNSKLVFLVQDSGIGIRDQDKQKLFNMFGELTKPKKNLNLSGAGLGLSVAGQLVKVLNKRPEDKMIHLESEPNRGSKFWFSVDTNNETSRSCRDIEEHLMKEKEKVVLMPLMIQESSKEAISRNILKNRMDQNVSSLQPSTLMVVHSLSEPQQAAHGRILIVDDNPFNLLAASFIAKKLGFEVDTADNGKECLEKLERSRKLAQHYMLILMDIQMPIMDGIETTQIINEKINQKKLYEVPIVALTAKQVGNRERQEYKRLGMHEALGKPLMEKELKAVINQNFGKKSGKKSVC